MSFIIAAALLNEPNVLLLQDNLRLSGAAYTVGAGRMTGPLFVCRGRCLIGPRAATWGRPLWEDTHVGRDDPVRREKAKEPLSGGGAERSEAEGVEGGYRRLRAAESLSAPDTPPCRTRRAGAPS